jgi:hypothetical protein
MQPAFSIYTGEVGKLRTSPNHLHFRWISMKCNIIFSVTRQGNGAVSHFTSDKKGLRYLKQALNDWCEFCFWLFDWCTMVIGIIEKISVSKLAEKCGFEHIATIEDKLIYIRRQ